MNRRVSRTVYSNVLPWLLGALLLRAFIPAGFAPAIDPTRLSASLCAAQMRSEAIEIPGATDETHCIDCLPGLGAPPSVAAFEAVPPPRFTLATRSHDSPFSRFALDRAQIPRAPPLLT